MGGIASALADKDFQSAMPDDQIKYLSSVDQDFAKAERKDQVAYLNHIKGNTTPTQIEKQNPVPSDFSREANAFGLGAASGASGLPETQHPLMDLGKSMAAPPTMGEIAEKSLGPGYAIGKQLYRAGRQIFSPSGGGENAAIERAHGVGTAVGVAAPLAIGEGIDRAPGELRTVGRSALLDPVTGEPTITPTSIAKRALRTPEEAAAAAPKPLGHPENPGWMTKLPDRLELPKPLFEPISNSPNIANSKYLAEQGKA